MGRIDDLRALEQRTPKPKRKVMLQGADATGDVPHVVSAMKTEPNYVLVIFEHGSFTGDRVKGSLTGFGISANRIQVIRKADNQVGWLTREQVRDGLTADCKTVFGNNKYKALHTTTDTAAKGLLDPTLRKEIFDTFRGGDVTADDARMRLFWEGKRTVHPDRPIVVLWGRGSGKSKAGETFGPHPEGDSSTTGLAQIATRCLEMGWQVLLVGDIPATKRDRYPKHCIYLGAVWDDPYWKGRLTQPQQVRLFYLLGLDRRTTLAHLGMRSGTLDYYAMAGQRIVYIVAMATDDQRIGSLMKKTEELGLWSRAQTAQPPKRTFNRAWPEEWQAMVARTDLKKLLGDADYERQKKMFDMGYPLDVETQLNAAILYKHIAGILKEQGLRGAGAAGPSGAELMQAVIELQKTRGFSDADLNKIIATAAKALQ